MPLGTMLAAALAILILLAAAAAALVAPRLGPVARFLAMTPLALGALGSLLGLAAAREPGVSPAWPVLYLATLAACILAVGRLALARRALS